jgi:hypothetical protein
MGQFVKGINNLDANMNNIYIFCISFFNQGIDLFYKLQNNLFGDLKMFNPPFVVILCHQEIWVPCGAPSLDLIPNLFTHQQFKITNHQILMKDGHTP